MFMLGILYFVGCNVGDLHGISVSGLYSYHNLMNKCPGVPYKPAKEVGEH